jgi:hypothetical protein
MTTLILARVINRGGLNMMNIGEPCEHKGKRFPFKIDAKQTYLSEIWEDGFNKSYGLYSKVDDMQSLSVA